jgi:hypothetical protein
VAAGVVRGKLALTELLGLAATAVTVLLQQLLELL